MNISRREFTQLLTMAGFAGLLPSCARQASDYHQLYSSQNFGDIRLLHITDSHAQLNPVYFREPSTNIGVNNMSGQPPHLVGNNLLKYFQIESNSLAAHAFTHLNFEQAANRFGKVGGFAHLKTLIDRLRGEFGNSKTLLLDGGDTWQGSGTALWTQGQDMVGASNLLGVDIMTGHWEFTYQDQQLLKNIELFKGEFLAQNIRLTEEAQFEDVAAFDNDTGHVFKPYTIKELNGHRIAVIGQAFPYTPIANPKRFIPDWTFGIRPNDLQALVEDIRAKEKPAAVILLSHNGMDVDLKLAAIVTGIDIILGGHTHDGIPKAIEIKNTRGITLVTNAGSNGKFVGVMDLAFKKGKFSDYRYRLIPVFSNLIPADPQMQNYIQQVRKPYQALLEKPLGVAGDLLYRRGNFNGSFDQVICNALTQVNDVQIALSPGFRWGTSVLSGDTIKFENVLDQTSITYPETYTRSMSGEQIKNILEDVADNLFNPDPFYQQGGDMVRLGGLDYCLDPTQTAGNRISEMRLTDGSLLQANHSYKVSGWATVGQPSTGRPIWDVVSDYIIDQQLVEVKSINTPKLKNVGGNFGL